MNKLAVNPELLNRIRSLLNESRSQLQQSVNSAMVRVYWLIGQLIVEHEQQGEKRAAYGKQQLSVLAGSLTKEFGRGFDVGNLRNMRRFYQVFPIQDAELDALSNLSLVPTLLRGNAYRS